MIPLIFLSISDHEYLEGKNLTLVMAANPYEKDNETMLGKFRKFKNNAVFFKFLFINEYLC